MDDEPRRPINKQTLFDVNLRVSNLIDQNGHWRMELLNDIFPDNEVKCILSLQIGGREDKLIWAYTKHGGYSVKSGHSLLANHEAKSIITRTTQEQHVIALKRRVWKIATVPKIRLFLWRVPSGALVVADRLRSRGLNVHGPCSLCQVEAETINHMLF